METNPERELPASPVSLTQAAIDAAPLPAPIDTTPAPLTPARKKQASYGALISIVIIMAIVIVGAFYAWGQRIHDQGGLVPNANSAQTY